MKELIVLSQIIINKNLNRFKFIKTIEKITFYHYSLSNDNLGSVEKLKSIKYLFYK